MDVVEINNKFVINYRSVKLDKNQGSTKIELM